MPKPKFTYRQRAIWLLESAERAAVRFNLQSNFHLPQDTRTSIETGAIHAFLMGALLHANADEREVIYEALRVKFDYTNEEIATEIIGG